METTATEKALRHDRMIVVAGLAMITAVAWIYLILGVGMNMSIWDMARVALSPGISDTPGMLGGMTMSEPMDRIPSKGVMAIPGVTAGGWPAAYWVTMMLMWWIMMTAMMTPSAAPMILLYAVVTRHAQTRGQIAQGVVPTATFAAGYLATWFGFSILATASQWGLEQAGLVSPMMMWSLNPWLSALVLFIAGLYQLTPLKRACLEHCRSPAGYLSQHWRPGRGGAFRIGANHGIYCVGCCWALMALLFVGGVMNLLWIVGLAVFVLIEKVMPRGDLFARAGGVACIAAAFWISARSFGLV